MFQAPSIVVYVTLEFCCTIITPKPMVNLCFQGFVSHTQFGAMQVSVPIVLDCLVFPPPTQDKVSESHPLN
jgi:hypothetical protein